MPQLVSHPMTDKLPKRSRDRRDSGLWPRTNWPYRTKATSG